MSKTSLVKSKTSELEACVKPKIVTKAEDLFMFKCACGGVHFRHAGYIETVMPFMRGDDKKSRIAPEPLAVKVCVRCRNCYVWFGEHFHDVTKVIDLNAWEKTEKEMQKATGPGGQC